MSEKSADDKVSSLVGRKAIDFYSWGHICFGIATFLLLSLIDNVPTYVTGMLIYIIPWWTMIVLVIAVAIIWEILENTLLLSLSLKFEGRRDSFTNATWDVIFAIIGSTSIWILKGILINLMSVQNMIWFYVISIGAFFVCLIALLIGYFSYKNKKKKNNQI
jgi:hypothetical protein